MPTCPNCGSVLPAGTVVCGCGTSLGGDSSYDEARLNAQLQEELMRENVRIIVSRARRLEAEGRYLDAVDQYYDALALDPLSLPLTQYLGDAYLNAGEYEKALDVYEDYHNSSKSYKVSQSMAYAFFKLKRYDEAIEKYMQTIDEIRHSSKLNPEFDEYRADDEEYVEHFKKWFGEMQKKQNELISGVWHDLGQVYDECQNYDKAIECYEEAIGYDYSQTDNWCCKATALENKGEYVDALKFYDIAIEMDPDDEEFKKNRLRCLKRYGIAYMNDEYQKECKYLDEALDLAGRAKLSIVHEGDDCDILDFDE